MSRLKVIKNIMIVVLFNIAIIFSQPERKLILYAGEYLNNIVFEEFKGKKLYVLQNDSLIELLTLDDNCSLKFVRNGYFICSYDYETSNRIIFTRIKDRLDIFSVDLTIQFTSFYFDGDWFYFTNEENQMIYRHSIITNKQEKLGIEGYVFGVDKETIFFTTTNENDSIVYANANVNALKSDCENCRPFQIMENIAGVISVLWSDQGWIFEEKLINGGFEPILIDYIHCKYTVIKSSSSLNATPIMVHNKLIFTNNSLNTAKWIQLNIDPLSDWLPIPGCANK
jgi:hypothetical protein